MAKVSRKKSKAKKAANVNAPVRIYDGQSRLNYLAAFPGIALIAATILELLMAVTMPSMKNSQFVTYSELFRMGFWASFIAGAVFLAAYWAIYVKGCSRREGLASRLRGRSHWMFFALFAVLIVISTLVNGMDDAAIHGIPYRNQGIFHILLYIGILAPVSMFVKTGHLRRVIMSGYILTADMIALAAAAFLAGTQIDAFSGKKGLCAIFFNGNHYGYFLVMAVLLAAGMWIEEERRGARIFAALSFVLNLALLFVNDSLGCMLAVFITLLGALVLRSVQAGRADIRSAAALGLFFALPLAGACVLPLRAGSADGFGAIVSNFRELLDVIKGLFTSSLTDSAGHNRWGLWSVTAGYISDRPLLGYGCEGISAMLEAATGRGAAHNELLSFAAFFGVPAAACYLLGVLAAFKRSVSKQIRLGGRLPFLMAAAGYFISSFAGVSMFYTTPFFFLFLGYALTNE